MCFRGESLLYSFVLICISVETITNLVYKFIGTNVGYPNGDKSKDQKIIDKCLDVDPFYMSHIFEVKADLELLLSEINMHTNVPTFTSAASIISHSTLLLRNLSDILAILSKIQFHVTITKIDSVREFKCYKF